MLLLWSGQMQSCGRYGCSLGAFQLAYRATSLLDDWFSVYGTST